MFSGPHATLYIVLFVGFGLVALCMILDTVLEVRGVKDTMRAMDEDTLEKEKKNPGKYHPWYIKEVKERLHKKKRCRWC